MQDWVQIILSAVGGGALITFVQKVNLLRSDKRKGEAEAERTELENDDIRFSSYVKTINDLNERMDEAMAKMRTLEKALEQALLKNNELKIENDRLRKENETLRSEIASLKGGDRA